MKLSYSGIIIMQAVTLALLICPACNAETGASKGTATSSGLQSAIRQSAALQLAALHYSGQSPAPTNPTFESSTKPQAAVADPVAEAIKINNQAENLAQKGQGQKAAALARKALAIMEKRFDPYNVQLAPVLNTLARATELEGNTEAAEALYRRALGIYESSLGAASQEAAITRINLANLLCQSGKTPEAQQQYEQALPILAKTLGEDPNLAAAAESLAALYEKQRNYALAAQLYERAGSIMESSSGKMSMKLVPASRHLAQCYTKQNRPDLAEPNLLRIEIITEAHLGRDHIDVAVALADLAGAMMQQGKLQAAQANYERALAIFDRSQETNSTSLAATLSRLAQINAISGRLTDAQMHYLRALSLEENIGAEYLADDLVGLANVYARQRKFQQAEPLLGKAIAIIERKCSQSDPQFTTATNDLAAVYEAQGKQLEALALYERVAAVSGAPRHTAQSYKPITPTIEEQAYIAVAQRQAVPAATRTQVLKNKMGTRLRSMKDSLTQR